MSRSTSNFAGLYWGAWEIRIVHVGGQGMGASLKMLVNQLLGTAMASFAEGLILGESLGCFTKTEA